MALYGMPLNQFPRECLDVAGDLTRAMTEAGCVSDSALALLRLRFALGF